jgi:hypothetical protein
LAPVCGGRVIAGRGFGARPFLENAATSLNHKFNPLSPTDMADNGAHVAEWSIVTTTGRGVLPSPRCGHSLSLTGAGDSGSRHLIVAFGETVRLMCCAAVLYCALWILTVDCPTVDVHLCLLVYTYNLLNGVES